MAQTLVIIAATAWGLVGLCIRQLTAYGFAVAEIAAMRSFIAAACLFAFLVFTDKGQTKAKPKDVPVFFCMGAFGIALGFIFYFNAVEMITLSAAAILLYTAPYYVMIMSVFLFKEKVTAQKLSALFIAFAGCVMTVGIIDSESISLMGVLAGLASAFCYSLYTIFGKKAMGTYSPLTVTAYTYGIASVVLFPLCDFGKMMELFTNNVAGIGVFLILGLFMTLLPSVCYMKALKTLEPSRASIIAFIEPLTASLAGAVVFSETLTPLNLLGVALIFLSLIILNKKSKSNGL